MPSKVVFDADVRQRCQLRRTSSWAAWRARKQAQRAQVALSCPHLPGRGYLLARFKLAARPMDRPTTSRRRSSTLARRAEKPATVGTSSLAPRLSASPGHSGGHPIAYGCDAERLYVVALPIWFGDEMQRERTGWTDAYRLYVERHIVWEITAARDGQHGLLNAK